MPWARLREVRRKPNRFGGARGRPLGWLTAVHPASACRLPRRPSGRKRAQPVASPFVVGCPVGGATFGAITGAKYIPDGKTSNFAFSVTASWP